MAGKKEKKEKTKKSNLLVEVVREFSVITWPKGKEFKNTSFIVLVFVSMYIIYIGFFDLVFKRLFDVLFS